MITFASEILATEQTALQRTVRAQRDWVSLYRYNAALLDLSHHRLNKSFPAALCLFGLLFAKRVKKELREDLEKFLFRNITD